MSEEELYRQNAVGGHTRENCQEGTDCPICYPRPTRRIVDVSVKPPVGPVHLGDGAYASFDGFQVWLGANHHDSKLVALQPEAIEALVEYAKRVWAQ